MKTSKKHISIRSPAHSDYDNSLSYTKRNSKHSLIRNYSGLLKKRSNQTYNQLTGKHSKNTVSPFNKDSSFINNLDHSFDPKQSMSCNSILDFIKPKQKESFSSKFSNGNLFQKKYDSNNKKYNSDMEAVETVIRSRTPNLGVRMSDPCLKINFNKYNNHFQTPKNFEIYSTKNVIPLNFNKSNPDINSILNQGSTPAAITLTNLKAYFQNFESSKYSTKPMNFVRAYAANTNNGIIRVSIILNIVKPISYNGSDWPCCSFFGVYDGHGGNECADYLRNNLHQLIIKDSNFPSNPHEAIRKGCERAETEFMRMKAISKSGELLNKSGSCSIVCIVVDNKCYIANVGDSRAIMSMNGGKSAIALSSDHKPNQKGEMRRIIENGGKIYQTQTPTKNINLQFLNLSNNTPNNYNHKNHVLIGPHRVLPGRLSVSRTFGDVEAKLNKFGGKKGVIIADPEITSFEIKDEIEFIILGCDGIFDHLSNEDIIKCVYLTLHEGTRKDNIHLQCALSVDLIMKSAMLRKSLDNITCLMIALPGFEKRFNDTNEPISRSINPQTTINITSNNNNYNQMQSTFGESELCVDLVNDIKGKIQSLLSSNSKISAENQKTNTRGNNEKKPSRKFIIESEGEDEYKVYHRQDLILHSGIEDKNTKKNYSEQKLIYNKFKNKPTNEGIYNDNKLVPDINPEHFNIKSSNNRVNEISSEKAEKIERRLTEDR